MEIAYESQVSEPTGGSACATPAPTAWASTVLQLSTRIVCSCVGYFGGQGHNEMLCRVAGTPSQASPSYWKGGVIVFFLVFLWWCFLCFCGGVCCGRVFGHVNCIAAQ